MADREVRDIDMTTATITLPDTNPSLTQTEHSSRDTIPPSIPPYSRSGLESFHDAIYSRIYSEVQEILSNTTTSRHTPRFLRSTTVVPPEWRKAKLELDWNLAELNSDLSHLDDATKASVKSQLAQMFTQGRALLLANARPWFEGLEEDALENRDRADIIIRYINRIADGLRERRAMDFEGFVTIVDALRQVSDACVSALERKKEGSTTPQEGFEPHFDDFQGYWIAPDEILIRLILDVPKGIYRLFEHSPPLTEHGYNCLKRSFDKLDPDLSPHIPWIEVVYRQPSLRIRKVLCDEVEPGYTLRLLPGTEGRVPVFLAVRPGDHS